MEEDTRTLLRSEGLLFEQPDMDTIWAGAGASPPIEDSSEWEAHRGVFRADSGRFGVMVNEEDHVRLISYRDDTDVLGAFSTLCDGLHALERAHSMPAIAASARRGFLTVSPANVGTGLRVTLRLGLQQLGRDKETLEAVCSQLLHQVAKSDVTVSAVASAAAA